MIKKTFNYKMIASSVKDTSSPLNCPLDVQVKNCWYARFNWYPFIRNAGDAIAIKVSNDPKSWLIADCDTSFYLSDKQIESMYTGAFSGGDLELKRKENTVMATCITDGECCFWQVKDADGIVIECENQVFTNMYKPDICNRVVYQSVNSRVNYAIRDPECTDESWCINEHDIFMYYSLDDLTDLYAICREVNSQVKEVVNIHRNIVVELYPNTTNHPDFNRPEILIRDINTGKVIYMYNLKLFLSMFEVKAQD